MPRSLRISRDALVRALVFFPRANVCADLGSARERALLQTSDTPTRSRRALESPSQTFSRSCPSACPCNRTCCCPARYRSRRCVVRASAAALSRSEPLRSSSVIGTTLSVMRRRRRMASGCECPVAARVMSVRYVRKRTNRRKAWLRPYRRTSGGSLCDQYTCRASFVDWLP